MQSILRAWLWKGPSCCGFVLVEDVIHGDHFRGRQGWGGGVLYNAICNPFVGVGLQRSFMQWVCRSAWVCWGPRKPGQWPFWHPLPPSWSLPARSCSDAGSETITIHWGQHPVQIYIIKADGFYAKTCVPVWCCGKVLVRLLCGRTSASVCFSSPFFSKTVIYKHCFGDFAPCS